MRNCFFTHVLGKSNSLANDYFDLPATCEVAPFCFERKESLDAHGHDRNAELVGENADSRPEWRHESITGATSLGKYQHAVTAIDRFSRKRKAFPKSRSLRKRENAK